VIDVSAIMHVHSTYSDGTATVPELLDAARDAGAGVLVLTDHDTLQARRDGWQGWHDGVLLVVGHEISPRGGHLLALGTPTEVAHAGRAEAELCREVAAVGGLAIAAHPFSEGSRM
jgi:predicted metal-dependent phosphoesterase TrpH